MTYQILARLGFPENETFHKNAKIFVHISQTFPRNFAFFLENGTKRKFAKNTFAKYIFA